VMAELHIVCRCCKQHCCLHSLAGPLNNVGQCLHGLHVEKHCWLCRNRGVSMQRTGGAEALHSSC
jgi:hypothetical protein